MSAAAECRRCGDPLTTRNARRYQGRYVGACRQCESDESGQRAKGRRLLRQMEREVEARAALCHALEQVYAGDQAVETDAVLDQLDTLGYRVVER